MAKTRFSRIALSLAIVLILASAFCLTAMAKTYDYTQMKASVDVYSPDNADVGGWEINRPKAEKGYYTLVTPEQSVGVEDSVTRYAGEVNDDLSMTYHIPATEQVKIKNFGGIEFNRRMSGTGSAYLVLVHGAKFGIVLTMDDGQTISRTYPWFDVANKYTYSLTTLIDKDIAYDIEALDGDPTLVSITYIPYVDSNFFSVDEKYLFVPSVADDPETEEDETKAGQLGSNFYFLTKFFTLIETADTPTYLSGVTDTFDGESVTEHNGKITGLKAGASYMYAPIYSKDADFVEISNATEITGLAGGVYHVYATEEGKDASAKAVVVVPKTDKGGISIVTGGWKPYVENNARVEQTDYPVYSKWTNAVRIPYPSSTPEYTNLAAGYLCGAINGTLKRDENKHATNVAYAVLPNEAFAEYYRRNIAIFTFVPSLDEQFDVDETAFTVKFSEYGMPFEKGTQGLQYAVRVYTNGDTKNPAIIVGDWFNALGVITPTISVSAREQLDGYVTRIDFVCFYNIPDGIAITKPVDMGAYNMLAEFVTYELEQMEAPVIDFEAADVADKYNITGLNSDYEYAYSSNKEDWITVSGVTKISNLDKGTYYVKLLPNVVGYYESELAEITISGAIEFAGMPELYGNTVKGLSSDAQYKYSKVDYFGASEWIELEMGAEEIADLTDGLWAIKTCGEGSYVDSMPSYVLVGDDSEKQLSIIKTVSGKKTVDISKTAPFVKGAWASTNFYKSLAVHSSDANVVVVRTDGFSNLAKDNETAFAQLLSFDLTYTMTDEQIVPLNKIKSFDIGFNINGYIQNAVFENKKTTDHVFRVRLYVAGGEQPYYDILGNWKGASVSQTVDVSSIKDDNAYVTAISIAPFGVIPEGANIQDDYKTDGTTAWEGRLLYPMVRLYSYNIKNNTEAPVLSLSGTKDGYRISGLDLDKNYAYSVDNKTWTVIPEGSTFFEVAEIGTYYVKSLNDDNYLESDVASIVVYGKQPTVSGLTVEGDAIKELLPDASYEYAVINVDAPVWTSVTAGATEISGLAPATYAVRISDGDGYVAGAAQYLTIKSDNYGSIAYGKPSKDTNGFKQGYWTSADKTIYNSAYTLNGVASIRMGVFSGFDYSTRLNYSFTYTMANDEVIPVANLNDFVFWAGYGVGSPMNSNTATMKVRVYVAEGDVSYYDFDYDYKPSSWSKFILETGEVIPADASGFVTAIKFWPVYEMSNKDGVVASSNYPVLAVLPYIVDDSLAQTNSERARIDIEAPAAPAVELALESGVYIKGYKIVGFDADKIYEYSTDGTSYTEIPQGTTELEMFEGKYFVRYAADENNDASKAKSIIVPMVNPVFAGRTFSAYKYTVSPNFSEGIWTNSIDTWGKTDPVTSYVNSKAVMSGVTYKYQFYEVDRVKVDENPYFSIDFNTFLANFNIPAAFISEAILEVDLYVEGEDTPYTLSTNHKGYTNNDGYTANKFTVNLLDEFPELAGKVITKFEIKPFANIDKTPNDYNTSATDDRYIYFRLYYMGFFDTPYNTDAAAKSTNEAVNTLVGIRAESNVVYGIGAKPVPTDFEVYEVYSDGQEYKIENFEIVVGENFAETSGAYEITVNGRLGTTCTTEVLAGLEGIAIKADPAKTTYFEGDKVDLSGIEIVAILIGGEEIAVESGYVAAVETVTADMTSITVMFGGKSAEFDITVTPLEVISISIATLPTKETNGGYTEGESVDLTGLTVNVTYNNGVTETLGLDKLETVYGADVMTRGTTLTVSYGGASTSVILTVNSKAISEITIITYPDKLAYMFGDEVDLSGLSVEVVYEDGTSTIVSDGFLTDTKLDEVGEVEVTVLYEGFDLTFDVEVIVIETAFIMEFPTKLEYQVGEEFNAEGLVLYVLFSNGEELLLTEGFELIYDEFTAEGEYEVVLKYFGYEEPFVVTVVAEEEPEPDPVVVESITVTAPTKTEYTVGDTLDLAGMVVTANLSDGTTENVTAAATVDTTTLATAGNVTVTVTYEGFTATFVVTVAEKVVEPEEPANIAEGTIEGTTVNWVITTDGTLTVSGEGEVPNYTRSATAPWYAYTKQIKKIVVADGITKLGDYCFYNLSKATAIEISTTVKFLGVQFIRQTAITEVTLTSDVTITANAFGRADNLKTLNLSEDVKNLQGNIFYQETVTIKAPENSFAHKYAEIYASKFASSAATVAYESDGTTAKLPIVRFAAAGDNAFFAIYENAKGNWALEVSGIGVMKNFPYVSAKNIAKGFTFSPMYYIGDEEAKIDGVEPEAKIASITVKEGITTVGNYIFYKCTKATTLTLPEGITSIGQGAFRLCQRIAKITLPEAVTKIEKNAFLSCGKLVEIYIPEGVTTVGEGIFEKCDSINSLVVKTKSAAAIEVISAEYPMVTIVSDF